MIHLKPGIEPFHDCLHAVLDTQPGPRSAKSGQKRTNRHPPRGLGAAIEQSGDSNRNTVKIPRETVCQGLFFIPRLGSGTLRDARSGVPGSITTRYHPKESDSSRADGDMPRSVPRREHGRLHVDAQLVRSHLLGWKGRDKQRAYASPPFPLGQPGPGRVRSLPSYSRLCGAERRLSLRSCATTRSWRKTPSEAEEEDRDHRHSMIMPSAARDRKHRVLGILYLRAPFLPSGAEAA